MFDQGENRMAEVKWRREDEEHGGGVGEDVVLLVHGSMYESVYMYVCNGEKGKRGHNDECNEIITLITVMMSTEQVGPDDIDIWLTTL